MNYRHAFHAGNHADVLKHVALVYCLAHLKRKETPFAVLDTHAGIGLYDLFSSEAMRSPEWRQGVGRLENWPEAPPAVHAYLDAIAAFNPDGATRFYPGSPAFIANALREDDVLLACELHPEDAATLRAHFGEQSNVHVHARDGWEALNALLPPPRSRGLVLIDPPYEEPDELERAARALGAALKRFGHGVFLWWRPLKSESALDRVDAEVKAQGARNMLRADLWVDTPNPQGKFSGSSILVINPPYGLEVALREALPAIAAKLALGKAGWRVA